MLAEASEILIARFPQIFSDEPLLFVPVILLLYCCPGTDTTYVDLPTG